MKSVSGMFKKIIAFLLCMVMLASVPAAFAQEAESGSFSGDEEDSLSIIKPEELQAMVDDYISSHGLNKEHISIGYCYTETGDTWLYNPDKWYYSASMYKVPLFMVMAEREYKGEYTQDSDINGMKLKDLEDMVLVNSNNYYAHHVMNYLGDSPTETMEGNRRCRELYLPYGDLPRDYYEDNFFDYSYFTARFMTNVMKTLYFENERFPGIVERLKKAQPNEYFNKKLESRYEVAQKYGALVDVKGVPFNHTAGIIYMPHPIILVVMTDYMGLSDETIADMALLFEDYSLDLDSKLSKFKEEEAEALRLKEEEEKRQAEEQERLQREKEEEAQRLKQEEQERLQREIAENEKAERNEKIKKAAFAVSGLVILAAVIIFIIKRLKKKAFMSQKSEKSPREKHNSGKHYTPKH